MRVGLTLRLETWPPPRTRAQPFAAPPVLHGCSFHLLATLHKGMRLHSAQGWGTEEQQITPDTF